VFDTFWTGSGTVFGVKTHKSLEVWVKSTDTGGSQVLVCWTGTFLDLPGGRSINPSSSLTLIISFVP
jgi:hypothetical protein